MHDAQSMDDVHVQDAEAACLIRVGFFPKKREAGFELLPIYFYGRYEYV